MNQFLNHELIEKLASQASTLLKEEQYQESLELLTNAVYSLNDEEKRKVLKRLGADSVSIKMIEEFYISKTRDNSEEFKNYLLQIFGELNKEDQKALSRFIYDGESFKPCLKDIERGVLVNVVDIVLEFIIKFSDFNNFEIDEKAIKEFLLKCLTLKFNSTTSVGRGELFFILFYRNTSKGNKGDIFVENHCTTYEIKGYNAMYGENIISGKGKIKSIFDDYINTDDYNITWALSGKGVKNICEILEKKFDNEAIKDVVTKIFEIYSPSSLNNHFNALVMINDLDKNDFHFCDDVLSICEESYLLQLENYIGDNIMILTDIAGNSDLKTDNNGLVCLITKDTVKKVCSATYFKNEKTLVKITPPGDSDQGYKPMLRLNNLK